MRTNLIPITIKSPMLSQSNVDAIKARISAIHPNLDLQGVDQYLCDLLNIESVQSIVGDLISFQEVEPAVSSKELHELAQRILPYNDGDMDRAIFSARNILNTIPKTVDDLIDYATKERITAFIQSMMLALDATKGKPNPSSVKSIDDLVSALDSIPPEIIDFLCNIEMESFQSKALDESEGVTERQRMLSRAADYYLNHKVGFKVNTMWLASFLSSFYFGCSSGWSHSNGDLCQSNHFGFKDDEGVVTMAHSSLDYLSGFFQEARKRQSKEMYETGQMYMRTVVFAVGALTKKWYSDGGSDHDGEMQQRLVDLKDLVLEHDDFMTIESDAFYVNTVLAVAGSEPVNEWHFELLSELIDKYSLSKSSPPPYILNNFDAWNFLFFEQKYTEHQFMAPLFLRLRYDPSALNEFAVVVLKYVVQGGFDDHMTEMLEGFFEGYLFAQVKENSDTMFMYSNILDIVKTAQRTTDKVNANHVIKAMAELGHLESIEHILYVISEAGEQGSHAWKYWEDRFNIIDSHNLSPSQLVS